MCQALCMRRGIPVGQHCKRSKYHRLDLTLCVASDVKLKPMNPPKTNKQNEKQTNKQTTTKTTITKKQTNNQPKYQNHCKTNRAVH